MQIHTVGVQAPGQRGGIHRGGFRGAFKTPSWGGSRPPSGEWGHPARPGFPPQGETGKGALQIPCCRRLIIAATDPGIWRFAPTPQVLTATLEPEFPLWGGILGPRRLCTFVTKK